MRKVDFPVADDGAHLDVGDVFDTCIEKARGKLRAKLIAVRPKIVQASAEYAHAAAGNQLHQIAVSGDVDGLTKNQLSDVYSERMVKGPGRLYYDRILVGSPTCPLCGVGGTAELDHHLPKKQYTLLTVAPGNLVPTCERCQGEKMTARPTNAAEETLHPYFDDFDSETWLKADVVTAAGAAFVFSADPPAAWGPTVAARLRRHLATFDLGSLYSLNAANHLAGIRQSLVNLHAAGGAEAVRLEMTARAVSWEANLKNTWEGAMHRAAAESQWFCGGGFAVK
ncbi:MAG: hypothetical protein NTV51_12520 [Verrucomicrobia bacterium]|nr:hypothetical protein [Verrucomicrobiota bacterium]